MIPAIRSIESIIPKKYLMTSNGVILVFLFFALADKCVMDKKHVRHTEGYTQNSHSLLRLRNTSYYAFLGGCQMAEL